MDFLLENCPVRPIDKSYIIDESMKQIKVNLTDGEQMYIKRLNGYERQVKMCCPNCNIPIAYHQQQKYLYVLPDSVSLAPEI
jgi:hypothetical protein